MNQEIKDEYWTASWCSQCGYDVDVDEEGCCRNCGLDALGRGAEEAHEFKAELAAEKAAHEKTRRERDEARIKLAYHDAMSPGLQILQPEVLETKAKQLAVDYYGQEWADEHFLQKERV
jgi:hypothetical protein